MRTLEAQSVNIDNLLRFNFINISKDCNCLVKCNRYMVYLIYLYFQSVNIDNLLRFNFINISKDCNCLVKCNRYMVYFVFN